MIRTFKFFATLAFAAALLCTGTAQSQSYPDRPIRIIVPYTPGSSADSVARALAPQLEKRLGVGIVIDNQGGGGGLVALNMAARAKPDGYTLVCPELGVLTVVPHLRKNLPYDPDTSFAPIGKVGNIDLIFAANPNRPFKTLKELVAAAKDKPGTLNYASGGTGTGAHIAAELFLQQAGINIVHVAYKGGGPATVAAVAGDVDYVVSAATSIVPMVKAGKLVALAITSPVRRDYAPDIPTAAESGMPELIAAATFGLLAPAGTPPAIIEKLRAEVIAITATEDFKKRANFMGMVPDVLVGEEFNRYIAAERLKWGTVVQKGGIRLDEEEPAAK